MKVKASHEATFTVMNRHKHLTFRTYFHVFFVILLTFMSPVKIQEYFSFSREPPRLSCDAAAPPRSRKNLLDDFSHYFADMLTLQTL